MTEPSSMVGFLKNQMFNALGIVQKSISSGGKIRRICVCIQGGMADRKM